MIDDTSQEFINRHIGPSKKDQEKMLDYIGSESLDQLIKDTVPTNILLRDELKIGDSLSESEALKKLKIISQKNQTFRNFIGMGYYNCFTPNVVLRNILENPGWYTSYTPYQPEVAQGRLEMLLNFQQLIIDFTGMDIANASLLDEATAAAEAVGLAQRVSKNNSKKVYVSDTCNPQVIDLIKTRIEPFGLELLIGNQKDFLKNLNGDLLCGVIAYPDTLGEIIDPSESISLIRKKGGKAIVVCDLLSLAKLKTPSELGADIAVGNAQRFGVPMGYGGPHAAFFATKEEFKRSMPGRIIGVSVDRFGKKAYRLSLQTREQHIRRDKATSNICTAQALLAIVSAAYAIYHGPNGILDIANRTSKLAKLFSENVKAGGFELYTNNFFDTVTIKTNNKTNEIYKKAISEKVNLRKVNDTTLSVAFDEAKRLDHVNLLLNIFGIDKDVTKTKDVTLDNLPKNLLRTSKYLTHPVFNKYHSETEMMRYLKRLEDSDIALNRSMIALGSCTMKLNSTAEMIPISWNEFALPHPFVPVDQMNGYKVLFNDLIKDLKEITGFDAVSLQPNSGAQGEYAGLMTIRAFHQNNNQSNRNVCLIPSSAHGTNPASAQMSGMKVVVINCDNNGNIDLEDLKSKSKKYSKDLAALMVTYPSTHGVFEEKITEICEIVHSNGGQVYMDGANLNALVGIAKPGTFGPDVCHINLHKTFCIPHGGGGPGMGPIACAKHLKDFLPTHQHLGDLNSSKGMGSVSAAPWGSASILVISWMYIKMMGSKGLKSASRISILNANYISKKLSEKYKVLYTGKNGNVAHECIIDIRPIKEKSSITEEDIAKRLIDYGYHAPTMSWPVSGTIMIEPTESENLEEIDRFCNALLSIKDEIDKIESGKFEKKDNPLINAPHTYLELTADEWKHSYSRKDAAFPKTYLKEYKYWAPVARVDNVYGDRNLVCSCPSMDEYKEEAA
jgi:glycine dehydrogenase